MNYIMYPTDERVIFPEKGYFQKGDSGTSILLITTFLAFNFIGYEAKTGAKIDDMLGYYFGVNLEKWIKQFQMNNDLEVDGCIGPITYNMLKCYGFKG